MKQIFQSPFNYDIYSREIVHRLFGCNNLNTRYNQDHLATTDEGDEVYYIGDREDAEGRLLGFFYTRSHSNVERKRVGLRRLIEPYLRYDVEAAIAVFDDGRRWRLSYICDLKEGTTSAKRYSYVLGDPQGQYKTPLERLQRIDAATLTLEDLKDAFSVETLSDEFFHKYHDHYDRIVRELIVSDIASQATEAQLHDYVKKMLGRIVFLHFLQKKGWLCGDQEFLKNLFFMQPLDRRADFLEQVLEPLFFGIFNTEPANRESLFRAEGWDLQLLAQWQTLPYLNGGLFERDEVDKLKIQLPASRFEELFEFLASYNFTVDENDPDDAEVGVDPEMLGKIFESLLEDNKAKGAFYTPKEIVRYMCKESLIAYLDSKLDKSSRREEISIAPHKPQAQCGDSEEGSACVSETRALKPSLRHFVEQHDLPAELMPHREAIAEALREVRICDPAIGSGAFPMGLLNELWRCREAVGDTTPRYALKREIIEHNIYGVDIERGAIDIARLRFWLSIVVDAEWDGDPTTGPEPLPNFDYKFMQGNSLIESFCGCDLSHMLDGKVGSRKRALEAQYGLDFSTTDTRCNLQLLLKKYFSLTDHAEKAQYRSLINYTVKSYILQQGISSTAEAQLQTLDPSANQHFFLWHTWFKDIFDHGGFDIVIGNPPYIQLQADGGRLGNLYKDCDFDTFARTGDIYSLFYEQGWRLLTKGGHLCFITSNKWMRAGYGEATRHFFATKTNPEILVDLGANVFDNATVDTNILLFAKSPNAGATICANLNKGNKNGLENLSDFVQQQHSICDFNSSDSWVILSPIEQSIKRKIEAVGTPLKDWDINIYRGVLTGCNEAFIIDTTKRDEILANCQSDEERERTAELIRPILRGRDIKRYGYNWAGLWLINTHNGVRGKFPRIDINDYPAVKQHLDQYYDAISKRADKGDTPYNLRNCAYLEDFFKPKIVYSETNQAFGVKVAFDTDGYYTDKTCFIITGQDVSVIEHVYRIMCSTVFSWYMRQLSPLLGRAGISLTKDSVELFPLCPVGSSYNLTPVELSTIEK